MIIKNNYMLKVVKYLVFVNFLQLWVVSPPRRKELIGNKRRLNSVSFEG